eukprot:g7002.t1
MPTGTLMFQHQQQEQPARRQSVLVRPPGGSHAGTFVQPRILASRAVSFRLSWERATTRQSAPKRQRADMTTSPGPESLGPRCPLANGGNATLRPNPGVARSGVLTTTMAALNSAHQPQPVRAPRLRQPPTPPSPPPFLPLPSARPALGVPPGLAGEGDGCASEQGAAAAPPPPEARHPSASVADAGESSAGETVETGDRLPRPWMASNGRMGQPGETAGGASADEVKGGAQGGGLAVEEAADSARGGASVGKGDGGEGGDVEWCPRAARDRACEAVPMLSEAFRTFDEKHPGATIIYLHHSGSRMYGTSTPNSDVDVKGIFIPDTETEARLSKDAATAGPVEAEEPDSDVDPDVEDSAGLTRPPGQPEEAGDRKLKGGKDATFWYSTGDTRSMNTKNDIDVELVSLDKFFGHLLRSEMNGVETLHSMLFEDLRLISDPEIVPLIVRERRWLVSKRLSSWVGMIMSHVHKYRKVTHGSSPAQRRLLQRRRELNAALLREARLAADGAAEPTVGVAVGAAPTSTSPSPPLSSYTSGVAASSTTPAKEGGGVEDSAGPRAAPVGASGAGRLGVISTGNGRDAAPSSRGGLGVISRGVTEAAARVAGGTDGPSAEPRRLGVLSRGGVQLGRGKAGGDREDAGDEEEGEEEEEEDWEAKEKSRKVRRGKLLQNARRGVMEAEELLAAGKLVFPLRPSYVRELLRLKELDFPPRKVGAIVAQAKRLKEIAARSGLPDEVSHEKVAAVRAEGAYLLKYTLPISDALCKGAFGAALALLLCYDATLVFFLVAKTRLTNGTRKLACWETVAIWWSRIYCLAYLCPMAIFLGLTCPGVVNEEGTQCYHEVTSTNIEGYVTNNCLLTVQFVILLALFVKPLLVPQEGTQSGGALYRRVVYRNVLCTFTIVVATLITTVVTTLAFLEISPESTKPRQVADVMPALNSFVTLCLTEIALPLGFTSGWKSIFGEHRGEQRHHDQSKVDGTVHSSKKATAARSHGSALAQPDSLGCFGDDRSDRVLEAKYTSSRMTPTVCANHCREKSPRYAYYATQWGQEDSNILLRHGDGTCDVDCSGDASIKCGGVDSFTLYQLEDGVIPSPPSDSNYVGCFADDRNDRVLDTLVVRSNMNSEVCAAICLNESPSNKYYATQYGEECWCAAEVDLRHGEAKCDLACAGDPATTCGGFDAFDLFELEGGVDPPVSEPTEDYYLGCFRDDQMDRVLDHMTSSGRMTLEACEAQCLGLRKPLFALQYGQEMQAPKLVAHPPHAEIDSPPRLACAPALNGCWCGGCELLEDGPDKYDRHGTASCSDYPCSGDASRQCAGFNAFSLYYHGTCDPTEDHYIGCFGDDRMDRVLEDMMSSDRMTLEACEARCLRLEKPFFALQYGKECWCGGCELLEDGPDNYPCPERGPFYRCAIYRGAYYSCANYRCAHFRRAFYDYAYYPCANYSCAYSRCAIYPCAYYPGASYRCAHYRYAFYLCAYYICAYYRCTYYPCAYYRCAYNRCAYYHCAFRRCTYYPCAFHLGPECR